MKNLKYFIPTFLLLCGAAFAVAEVNFNEPITPGSYQTFNFFKGGGSTNLATTTSATSTNIAEGGGYMKIAGAKKVVFYFSRSGALGANTGISRFEVEVSPDGTNWYDHSRLFLMDKDQTATSSVSISAATSTTVAELDLEDGAFYGVRCQVVETTDGEHTCKAAAEY